MAVFVTTESKARYWNELVGEIGDQVDLTQVTIPWGGDEAQLWEIFDRVVGVVEEGDRVLFDITHGFRSLPFLVFLAVAYLKMARAVEVEGIVYGAYDARDGDGVSPVFDLTPMVSLLDWLDALGRFQRAGDGSRFEPLLREIQAQAHREDDPDAPRTLIPLGQTLKRFSTALRVVRPVETAEQAAILRGQLTDERIEQVEAWARPFALVARELQSSPLLKGLQGEADPANLAAQSYMLDWYVDHEQWTQAIVLAREMLVTLVVLRTGLGDPLEKAVRDDAEAVLTLWELQLRGKEDLFRHNDRSHIERTATAAKAAGLDSVELGSLWGDITAHRNDLCHAGMRQGASGARALRDGVVQDVTRVRTLMRS